MELKATTYDVKDGVGLLTLNRPDQLNAINDQLRDELIWVFGDINRDDTVRAVVVTGAGKAFCAGADLSEGAGRFDRTVRDGKNVPMSAHRDGGGRVALSIFNCRKAVIAAINGPAVGAGLTITLPMDIRIAAEDAKVGFVFARRGIVPEACSTWFLPRIVGMTKATELTLTGRIFNAAQEANSGLFNAVVPREEVLPKAMATAREIADNTSAVSVALTKGLLWHNVDEPDPQAAHLTDSRVIYWIGSQKDAYEGVQSFLEKRPAEFTMSADTDMPDFYPWWKETKV